MSLEPLPTKQLVSVSSSQPRAAIKVEGSHQQRQSDNRAVEGGSVYPWLLAASTCLSMVLCWMYVTKPVIVSSMDEAMSAEMSEDLAAFSSEGGGKGQLVLKSDIAEIDDQESGLNSLVPSEEVLPGSNESEDESDSAIVDHVAAPLLDDFQRNGWEKTNLKVQHIRNADYGNGQIEKIFIDVPVFYQTRTMLWTPEDVLTARDILSRLMVYEGNISQLKSEGEAILRDWNQLLEKSVPSEALRADSPTLPYNHSSFGSSKAESLGDSLIKLEKQPLSTDE
ncbi:MAG: hypothetical protein ACSHX0_04885 [Akkermansiaceae bacterium]